MQIIYHTDGYEMYKYIRCTIYMLFKLRYIDKNSLESLRFLCCVTVIKANFLQNLQKIKDEGMLGNGCTGYCFVIFK